MFPYAGRIVVGLILFRIAVWSLINRGIDAAAGQSVAWYDIALAGVAVALIVAVLLRYRTRLDPGS